MSLAIPFVVFAVACGLLVVTGSAKVVRPSATGAALAGAGLPGPTWGVRGLGVVEIFAGVAGLARPGTWTGLAVSVLYVAFAGFLVFLLVARPGATSCGCAGSSDAPPSWVHAGLDLVAAGSAAAVAISAPDRGLFGVAADLGWAAVPAAIGLIAIVWLAAVVARELQPAWNAFRRPEPHPVEPGFEPDRHARADSALAEAGVGPGHASLWPDAEEGWIRPADPEQASLSHTRSGRREEPHRS